MRRSRSGVSWRRTIAQPSRPPSASSIRPIWITQSIVLQLGDVGPMRAERKPPDLSPAGRAPLERLGHRAGVLPGGPDEDGRPRSGDRRPEGAELSGRVDQLHRARVEIAAALLVDAVAQAAPDQVE